MNKERLIETIGVFSDLPGASGFEGELEDFSRKMIKEFYPEAREISAADLAKDPAKALEAGVLASDKMHNLSFSLPQNKGNRLRVLLDAHLDEVAFMVSGITANGLLKMQPLGGWAPVNIGAHEFHVIAEDGKKYYGITASKPPHYMSEEERRRLPGSGDFLLDIGTRDLDFLQERGIGLGCPVVPLVKSHFDQETGIIHGKAFDCRIGCASMVDTVSEIADKTYDIDVYSAFASQEEVGTRGAQVLAARIEPDLCIVFEGCPADDSYGDMRDWQTAVGKGPMLRHIDAGMITNPGFQRFALETAEKYQIPVQTAVRSGGSTNGKQYHLSRKAAPCIVIGVPVRYAHTHYGQSALSDLVAASKLAQAIIAEMNDEVYNAM